MNIFQTPGLHTDTPNPADPHLLWDCGFKWIVQQTQNGNNPLKPLALTSYRGKGFKIGPWGVSYTNTDPIDDSKKLLQTAQNQDLLVMNVEHPHDPTPFINGLKAFTGPKALITLVGILDKIGVDKYLDAGWQIIGETYLNDQDNLTPAVAEFQAKQAGIPPDRFSHALGMYWGRRQRFVTGAEYAAVLKAAGSGRRFSLWMVEQGPQSNWLELKSQALYIGPVPEPEKEPSSFVTLREHAESDLESALALVATDKQRGSAPRPFWAHKLLHSSRDELLAAVPLLEQIWPRK